MPVESKYCSVFQSTLPARGATSTTADAIQAVAVSIHAPRAGSDVGLGRSCI